MFTQTRVLALLAVSTLALASSAFADPSQIYGKWISQMDENGFAVSMQLDIEAQQVTFTDVCTYNGQSATSSAAVPAQVTDTDIILSGSANQSSPIPGANGASCDLQLAPMDFSYTLNGQELDLMVNGQTLAMTRSQ
jgi:hypothetical protein